jgi:ABC-type lipoprotein release transport system permease subunit
MTTRHINPPFFSSFLNKILIIISIFGIIGFALGFTKYFNNTYYFPLIPNVFDSVFLILASLYLGINILMLNRLQKNVK